MKRNDWILLAAFLAVGLLALSILYLIFGGSGSMAVVTVGGEEVLRLPLDKDTEVMIQGANGGSNLLVIKDGQAFFREASCPDKVCVHTGVASELKSVVCAPNTVVLLIEN